MKSTLQDQFDSYRHDTSKMHYKVLFMRVCMCILAFITIWVITVWAVRGIREIKEQGLKTTINTIWEGEQK